MALKIRLKRMGAKKAPFYRVVVAEAKMPRDGRFVEEIGYYDPIRKDLKIDNEAALKWMKNGAQPTETARSLLVKSGVIQSSKKNYKQTAEVAIKQENKEAKNEETKEVRSSVNSPAEAEQADTTEEAAISKADEQSVNEAADFAASSPEDTTAEVTADEPEESAGISEKTEEQRGKKHE